MAMLVIVGSETTVARNDFMSLSGGLPSSVTRTVKRFVEFKFDAVLGQTIKPFVELIHAPAGAASRLNVNTLPRLSLAKEFTLSTSPA